MIDNEGGPRRRLVLALLVFGWEVLPPRVHFFSTVMVCLGAHFSAIWIVVANSWMQTPAGYHLVAGPSGPRAEIVDFWAMVFNPSSVVRLTHVVLGAWLAGAFLVLSVSAWYLLRKDHERFALASMRVAAAFALTGEDRARSARAGRRRCSEANVGRVAVAWRSGQLGDHEHTQRVVRIDRRRA